MASTTGSHIERHPSLQELLERYRSTDSPVPIEETNNSEMPTSSPSNEDSTDSDFRPKKDRAEYMQKYMQKYRMRRQIATQNERKVRDQWQSLLTTPRDEVRISTEGDCVPMEATHIPPANDARPPSDLIPVPGLVQGPFPIRQQPPLGYI